MFGGAPGSWLANGGIFAIAFEDGTLSPEIPGLHPTEGHCAVM